MYSVLLARWTYTVRMQRAYRVHMLNNQTNAQRVASARKRMTRACSVHAEHAQRTARPYLLHFRWICVRSTLGVRSACVLGVCAQRALGVRRQTYNVYPACVWRWSAHGWRPSGVYIQASSSTHIFARAQKSRRTQRTTANA